MLIFGEERRRTLGSSLAFASLVASVAACSVYDASLLDPAPHTGTHTTTQGTGGATGTGGAIGTGGQGTGGAIGTGGAQAGGGGHGGAIGTGGQGTGGSGGGGCKTADDCPGADSACSTRTCAQGACGVTYAAAGASAGPQTPGTCQKLVCDGKGGSHSIDDDTNTPKDDGKECTVEACVAGAPKHTPKAAGSACSQASGKVCSAAGDCVECLVAGDCASGLCDTNTHLCVAASCKDGKKNGSETDIDCGGACSPCALGKACLVGNDCVTALCTSGKCAPTCTDGLKDGSETDVDCGGACAKKCDFGQTCSVGGDCAATNCSSGKCVCVPGCVCDHLLISQIRSRGAAGGSDEFVELYNPTASAITLDAKYTLEARSTGSGSYTLRFTGSGAVLPSHGYYLLGGSSYAGSPAADDAETGVTDASSVRLLHSGVVVDAVCYAYSPATLSILTTVANGYTCSGTPVSNSPHTDASTAGSNVDVGFERKPGGAAGNCTSTGDDVSDFVAVAPAVPRNSASPPAP